MDIGPAMAAEVVPTAAEVASWAALTAGLLVPGSFGLGVASFCWQAAKERAATDAAAAKVIRAMFVSKKWSKLNDRETKVFGR
ncbi:hypothetical protein [Caulobacter sp. CCH9-E1]|uniref:hypothetical protein n=1 Tax=Caulobacter sp. CCH9-E1 TaxID=1768768 RepID=UPI001E4E46E6|nr:hypothetical protein [Caulobacter sp. CCH9-E1]